MPREPLLCQFGLLIFVCDDNDLRTTQDRQLSRFEFCFEPSTLNFGLPSHSFPGGSGAPPTCKWLKSCNVCRSSSLIPRVKFGSLSRRFLAGSGIFCRTPSFC